MRPRELEGWALICAGTGGVLIWAMVAADDAGHPVWKWFFAALFTACCLVFADLTRVHAELDDE